MLGKCSNKETPPNARPYAHAKQYKRMRRELKRLRTYLGRVYRDDGRKIASDDEQEARFARLLGLVERLSRDPAMRAIVERKGLDRRAASTSQMGRFATEWLAVEENLAALTHLSGIWIDRVHVNKSSFWATP